MVARRALVLVRHLDLCNFAPFIVDDGNVPFRDSCRHFDRDLNRDLFAQTQSLFIGGRSMPDGVLQPMTIDDFEEVAGHLRLQNEQLRCRLASSIPLERITTIVLNSEVLLRSVVMRRSGWTPSIVPAGDDQNVYIVVDDFGRDGCAYRETDVETADLETTITDLMEGQYHNPIRVVAFNTAERWSEDVSEDVAREIRRRCDLRGADVLSDRPRFRRLLRSAYTAVVTEAGLNMRITPMSAQCDTGDWL